jgi:hypothetical protein
LAVGEGAQQQRAGDGEDGGVGSDGERQGEHGDKGEGRIAAEHAQAETEIAEKGLHKELSPGAELRAIARRAVRHKSLSLTADSLFQQQLCD